MEAGARLTRDELFALPAAVLLGALGARVAVQSVSGATQTGVLYCVDAHGGSLALLQEPVSAAADDSELLQAPALWLVLKHGLASLEVLEASSACCVPDFRRRHLFVDRMRDPVAPSVPPFDEDEAQRRRADVEATLAAHRVPCESVAGELRVLGCLTLAWPFTAEAAVCANPRVLERVLPLLPGALQYGSSDKCSV